jgi:glycosyltransferase involved in cell wall biosynthesis
MGYTVLSVAYPLMQVGEDAVGGSEQVLTQLDRALTEAGNRSLVIAAEGSKVYGTLLASPPANCTIAPTIQRESQKTHKELIRSALSRYSVDVVHMHSLDFHCYLPDDNIPTIATLHLPPDWYPPSIFNLQRKHLYLNCVSSSQERACPPSPLLLPNIPNGVDISRLQGRRTKGSYALTMGRICPEKGFHIALDAANSAGVDCVLAGEVARYSAHEDYFRSEIVPRLDKRRRFVGRVGFHAKRRLLLQAKCLLIPSEVRETSSLVAMEALAAGTPVIAFASGALPEIIEHGRTGYIVSGSREMARAIHLADKIDPEECRREARRRFQARRMVDRYMQTYRDIISRKTAVHEPAPTTMTATSWLVSG